MSPIVLIVAGIFVVAGLVLIVLSFLVGRSDVGEEEQVEEGVFIDRPLESDMERDLGAGAGAATAAEPAAEPESPPSAPPVIPSVPPTVPTEPEKTAEDLPSESEDTAFADNQPTGEIPTPVPVAIPDAAEVSEEAMASSTDEDRSPQQQYDFRVRLGFELLESGRFVDAATEFQKAVGHTDDPAAKLNLYVEIGNVFRSQDMIPQAMAAYMQATEYADDDLLREHLERTMAEMAG